MGKMKEKSNKIEKALVVEEFVLQIESDAIRKMKVGQLGKMADNIEILKELRKTPGLRIRVSLHNVDFADGLTTDEFLEAVFQGICKKLHLKNKIVFLKGQVFLEI